MTLSPESLPKDAKALPAEAQHVFLNAYNVDFGWRCSEQHAQKAAWRAVAAQFPGLAPRSDAVAADARPAVAYVLPDALRRELGAPFGPVLSTEQLGALLTDQDALVCVGDVVSLTVKELGRSPRLFVCDFQTQRGQADRLFETELGSWGRLAFRVRNPAGQVTREAWDAIRLGLAHGDGGGSGEGDAEGPVRVFVEGEEDLLGLPCFLEAPIGAKVLYGMPGQGVAVVEVTAALQGKVRALLARFGTL